MAQSAPSIEDSDAARKAYQSLQLWQSKPVEDRAKTLVSAQQNLANLYKHGRLSSLAPALPFLLQIKGKPFTLDRHFPMEPLYRRYDIPPRMILKCGRQVSKCCVLNDLETSVRLSNGRPVKLADIQVGDEVVSLDESSFRANTGRVVTVHYTGVKPVLEVRTRMGRRLKLTAEHRLRTLLGYRTVAELQTGDRLVSFRREIPVEDRTDAEVSDDRVGFTAYMLGDGCCGAGALDFTSMCDESLAEMRVIASSSGVSFREYVRSRATSLRFSKGKSSTFRQWLEEDGLWNTRSHEKFIPPWVFDLDSRQMSLFVTRLWSTDGWAKTTRDGFPYIGFFQSSLRMAIELQAILSRFGVMTSRAESSTLCNGKSCKPTYVVRVEGRESACRFFQEFRDIPGKPEVALNSRGRNSNRDTLPSEVQEIIGRMCDRCLYRRGKSLRQAGLRRTLKYPPSREKIDRYLDYFGQFDDIRESDDYHLLANLRHGDVVFDEIVSISPAGEAETGDIEVESDHNFSLDGVVSHNSTSLAALGILRGAVTPNLTQLFLAPLCEQIQRFSSNVVSPLIKNSPIRSLLLGQGLAATDKGKMNVFQRSFANDSLMYFSFAFLDVDRIRGIPADMLYVDEVQDFQTEHLPVAVETMSASEWGLESYSGTPKTPENLIHYLFEDSSHAHWATKCEACNHWNVMTLSQGLDEMVQEQGLCCSNKNCRRLIDPSNGQWVHAYPDRSREFLGLHVPQPLLPLHYANPNKWATLYRKKIKYPRAKYLNEVLGETADVGSRLVSRKALQEACRLPWTCSLEKALEARQRTGYSHVMMGVDWSGGGAGRVRRLRGKLVVEDGTPSFTHVVVVGFGSDANPDVLYAERLSMMKPDEEVQYILSLFRRFGCVYMGHDYGGAGNLREVMMNQSGMPSQRLFPFQYGMWPTRPVVVENPPNEMGSRHYFSLDKTRAMSFICSAITSGMVRFPDDWEHAQDYLDEFLNLVEDYSDRGNGSFAYRIMQDPRKPCDFPHAMAFACFAYWHTINAYPDLASKLNVDVGGETLYDVNDLPTDGWD